MVERLRDLREREYSKTGVRIVIDASYSFLTTTDLEALLKHTRVPIMREFRRRGSVGYRDRLNIEEIKTGNSIHLDLSILVDVAKIVAAMTIYETLIKPYLSESNRALKGLIGKRRNIKRIKRKIIVEEEIVEEETFGEEELTNWD